MNGKYLGEKQNSRKFQNAKLEFAVLGNYLKRIYIVFTTIYTAIMLCALLLRLVSGSSVNTKRESVSLSLVSDSL